MNKQKRKKVTCRRKTEICYYCISIHYNSLNSSQNLHLKFKSNITDVSMLYVNVHWHKKNYNKKKQKGTTCD